MKKTTHFLLLLIPFLSTNKLSAQQNLTLYNMEVVPQRMYVNPAFFPSYSRINIGIPLLSSEYLNFSNSGFKYSDIIRHRGDSLYLDFDNMLSKVKKNNYLSLAYQPDIISFGFAIKKNYFSFNITEKINLQFRYPKNFLEFIWKGNGGVLGQDMNFNFGINFSHYREYGLGYAREVNDKLSVGAKFKYLYGMENVWTERSDIILNTDPNDFAITAKSNIKINSSGLDTNTFNNFNVSDYAFKKKNNGFAADLGAVYKLTDKLTVSGSVVDLGFIKWKQDVTTYQTHDPNDKFTYAGFELNQLVNSDTSKGDPIKVLTDSLIGIFKLDSLHASYKTKLSTQLYLGANYNLNKNINAGILFYSQIFDKGIHPGAAVSYNQKVGRWLAFSLSYSIYNRSYNNVGLGLSLNGGPVQFYIISDNVLAPIFPQKAKNLNLHFGINLTFKKKPLDKDKDGVPDKKDECPDMAGLIEFKGCPDRDGDHITDKADQCPDIAGLAQFHGCPDKDGDGIIDGEDACPEMAGLPEFKGCPDKDGDKVIDKEDDCPDESGLPELKGCPDKDGDSVIDKEDACPDEKGLSQFKGCPDKDGDGVMDKIDLCPEKSGPESNNGCPEIKLNMLDKEGKVLKVVVRGKDGTFTFETMPADENVIFKIEGEETDGLNEILVNIGGITKKMTRNAGDRSFQLLKETNTVISTDVVIKLDKKEEEILKKAFSNLEFAAAKELILPASLASLDELAGLMAKKPNWRLKISGHTDNKGKPVTNLKLSQKRAEAVKKYLLGKGIAEKRFKVEWFGSKNPIADNNTEEGRQKNRRVEMLIIE